MQKIVYALIIAALFFPCSAQAEGAGWKVDETLKVQLVYLPCEAASVCPTAVADKQCMQPLLKNIPASQPDIDNIVYKNILGLGFPLPARTDASTLKLYLKLYAWPVQLDPARSSHKIFDDFLLYGIAGGERLYESSKHPGNVYVKYALIDRANKVFSDKHPFRAPVVPEQWVFDAHLPFSSIYVTPEHASHAGTEADQARASAQGVIALHAALGTVYEKLLHLLAVTDEKRFFADFRRCPDSDDKICGVRIYEVPRNPLVFANYRELPMPQDTHKVFLSGLLLVKLTDYAANAPMTRKDMEKIRPGTMAFDSRFHPVWSHMLEIGSVLDVRE